MPPKRKTTRVEKKKAVDEEVETVDEKRTQEGLELKYDDAVEPASRNISSKTTSNDQSTSVVQTSEGQHDDKDEKDDLTGEGVGGHPVVNKLEPEISSPYPYLYPSQGAQYPQGSVQHHPPQFATTQYPPANYAVPQYPPFAAHDPDQEYYMQYYSQQNALSTPTPGMSYETRRSQNQMSHYFDTTKYPVNQPMPIVHGQAAPMKVTKKDIERFKKRKEEKKRMKNKWLFE